MDLTVVALAGVLLLGAGVTILVVNLRKSSGAGLVDQIGTYGYVAETTGGSEAEHARTASSRLPRGPHGRHRREAPRVRRGRAPPEARRGGHVRDDAAQDPRLPGSPRSGRARRPHLLVRDGRRVVDHLPHRAADRRRCPRLVRASSIHSRPQDEALRADRQADAGHDRPARRHDRGRARHPRVDARRRASR